jgi:hypothetical protein
MLPTLVRQLEDKDTVVFHCALSQQRGPSAALRYIRERERLLGSKQAEEPTGESARTDGESGSSSTSSSSSSSSSSQSKVKEQKVWVLDRGFVGWQEQYGTDERLTEGYRKELWEDGYWG